MFLYLINDILHIFQGPCLLMSSFRREDLSIIKYWMLIQERRFINFKYQITNYGDKSGLYFFFQHCFEIIPNVLLKL